MNSFKKFIGVIAIIFFGIVTIFWSRNYLFFIPFIFLLLSILFVLKISNTDIKTIKKIKIIGLILFFILGIYSWRYNDCSPDFEANADYTIDPVYEKSRMKSCMTFGVYKNTIVRELN